MVSLLEINRGYLNSVTAQTQFVPISEVMILVRSGLKTDL
jgi:hypothetical protein